MKMEPIRMGVIGLGAIARNVHIPGIQRSPDAVLAAVCDSDTETLEERRLAYGLDETHAFSDYRDLLRCPDVDAVSICTPNAAHLPIALAAVEAGKPFALEKPVTLAGAGARRLLDAAETAGVPAMVCFSYRFKAAARYARDLIRQGRLGRLRHVYCQYLQNWAGPATPRVWRFDRAIAGSGALGDLGSHMLDLVRFLTGDEIDNVLAQNGTFINERASVDPAKRGQAEPVDVDDYSHFFATMHGGAAASFLISRFAYGRDNYQRVEVYGDEGALVYSLEQDDRIEACIGDVYRSRAVFTPLPVPWHFQADQMQSFFDRIRGRGGDLAGDLRDGWRNQCALDAVLASASSGRCVPVDYTHDRA